MFKFVVKEGWDAVVEYEMKKITLNDAGKRWKYGGKNMQEKYGGKRWKYGGLQTN